MAKTVDTRPLEWIKRDDVRQSTYQIGSLVGLKRSQRVRLWLRNQEIVYASSRMGRNCLGI